MVNGFKIPKITTHKRFITLKKAADDNVRMTKPSPKQFHGFDIPKIKEKKKVRFSPQQQTFYFGQGQPENSLLAAAI